MQISPTMLASLTTMATGLVQTTAEIVQPIGEGFVETLRSLSSRQESTAEIAKASSEVRSAPESLDKFIGRLREWFSKSGATKELDVQLTIDQFDQVHVKSYGETAEHIEQLLMSNPQWLSDLREAAINERMQANNIGGTHVQEIGLQKSGHRFGRSEVQIHMVNDEATIRWL